MEPILERFEITEIKFSSIQNTFPHTKTDPPQSVRSALYTTYFSV